MRDKDHLYAVLLAAIVLAWATIWPENKHLDALGVVLAVAATLPLAVRRRWPIPVLAAHVLLSIAYNTMDYPHDALLPPGLVALYTVASTGDRVRSLVASGATCVIVLIVRAVDDGRIGVDTLGTLGWLVVAIVMGEVTRNRHAEIVRRGEEDARRQVTEERLRIARDLHDLLAHSITMIRVQAGVAAHLIADTDKPPDRTAVTRTLDTITEACDQARAELRSTVEVLRDPVPVLPSPTDLGAPVRAAGIAVAFTTDGSQRPLPPTVEIAVYRIVQESLTNVVKHSGATEATVHLDYGTDVLTVTITDNGHGNRKSESGYGLIGMTERARTVGGRLRHSADGGFTVTAELPTGER
jgi:signal transduction histidine kinase